jgi:uncharacterized protein YjcR
MGKTSNSSLIPADRIARMIVLLRGQKVMLDADLAQMYGVEVKQLKRQARRNIDRFPQDFMFELSSEEYRLLRCQSGTLKRGAHSKYLPYAFTEQGVAMLSSVLKSKKAIHVNIAIMRVFVRLREILSTHKDLAHKLSTLETRIDKHDHQIQSIFDAINQLISPPEKPNRHIGFHIEP